MELGLIEQDSGKSSRSCLRDVVKAVRVAARSLPFGKVDRPLAQGPAEPAARCR